MRIPSVEEKHDPDEMRHDRKVDQQMPYHVVVAKPLPGIEPGAERVEYTARGDQHQQRR